VRIAAARVQEARANFVVSRSDLYLSFAKTPPGEQVVDLSALIRRRS
jgi:hypothetical protein